MFFKVRRYFERRAGFSEIRRDFYYFCSFIISCFEVYRRGLNGVVIGSVFLLFFVREVLR